MSFYDIVNRLGRHLNENHVLWVNDFENKKKRNRIAKKVENRHRMIKNENFQQ